MTSRSTTFAIFAVYVITMTSEACPDVCTCPGKTVLCMDTAMDVLPSGIPADTEALQIRGSYSQRSQFHRLGGNDIRSLTSLKTLAITHTLLDSIDENAFQGLTSLVSVDLSFNELAEMPAHVFGGLTSLAILHLTGNEHLSLPSTVFQSLSNLRELYLSSTGQDTFNLNVLGGLDTVGTLDLSNNNIKDVPSSAASLAFLRSLRLLDLSFNQLSYLGNDTAPLLTRVPRVLLYGNPWDCNCELQWMQRFRNHIFPPHQGSQVVTCQRPDDVAFRAMALLSPQQFVCTPPRIVSCDPVLPQDLGATFQVRCNMTGQPFPFVSWKTADGSTTIGSTRHLVIPQLDIQEGRVTLTLMASRALNGTLTVMAQSVSGMGTHHLPILVKDTPTTTTTATTTPATTTATLSPNGTTEERTEGGGEQEGGGNLMLFIVAGAAGGVLLVSLVVMALACRKMKKAKVSDPENNGSSNTSKDRHNTKGREERRGRRDDVEMEDSEVEEMDSSRQDVRGARPPTSTRPISAWDF